VALETVIVEKWMIDLMLADAAIGALIGTDIYPIVAPQGLKRPFMLVIYQQGSDINSIGERSLAQPLFQVKMVGRHQDVATLRAGANRIDALLQDKRVVVAGYQIRVQREMEIRTPDFGTGVEYENMGGMYRCWVSLAA